MDKEKVLNSLERDIEWAKKMIDSAHKNKNLSDVKYLNGHLEAYEGIKKKVEDGYWD